MDRPPSRAEALLVTGALILTTAIVGCASLSRTFQWSGRGLVPVSGWDEESWGPVVPHESFPGECDLCHTPEGWTVDHTSFQFDHAKETGTPLTGAHAQAVCLRCHNDRGPVQRFAARGCGGCHVDPHEASLGASCDQCHGELSWVPQGIVSTHLEVGFPLFGAHAAVACDRCHPSARSGDYRGAPRDCLSCHREDQQRAVTPVDHVAAGYVECDRCHRPTTWQQADFPHDTFPLRGGHAISCSECHTGGSFTKLPTDCVACHQADYAATTNPNHATAGFSTDCATCHTINGWQGAHFNHTFPLTGGHAIACDRCHTGGTFTSLPTDCYACHQADYAATTNPNHATSGYSTSCATCHTTTTWQGAVFNHSFPLQGDHNVSCNVCHLGGDTTTFSCTQCHTQSKTDADHSGEPGYVYASPSCLACHPDGKD